MFFTLSSIILALVYHLWIHRVNIENHAQSSLALWGVVMGVYFLDRYLDTSRSIVAAPRKIFAQGGGLIVGLTVSAGLLVYGLWGITDRLIAQGVLIGALLFPYFYFFVVSATHPILGAWKEAAIAFIFGLGVGIPLDFEIGFWAELASLSWLIFLGLVLISDIDRDLDRVNRMPNLFLYTPFKSYRFTYGGSLILLPMWWQFDLLIEMLSTLVFLEIIYTFKDSLKADQRLHILVDSALLLPFLIGIIL